MIIPNNFTTYDTEKNNPYIFATDCMYNNRIYKKYKGTNNKYDVINFYNRLIKYKPENRNYYEIIKETCRPYFDFDKINITRDELTVFVEIFINNFNLYFNTKLDDNNFIITYRDSNNKEYITSIHIIIIDVKIEKHIIKKFIDYLKLIHYKDDMTFQLIINSIDDKIYTKNRLFNLYNNTKLKYVLDVKNGIETNYKLLIDFTKPRDNLTDYMACFYNITDYELKLNCKINFITTINKINNNTIKKQLRVAFNKLKQKTDIEKQDDDKTIMFIDIKDTFEWLITILPNKFYYNSNDWKILTNILIKNNINEKYKKIWIFNSSNNTNNKWTENNNQLYINNINIEKIRYGIPKFKELVKFYTGYNIVFTLNNIEVIKWIQNKTGKNFEDVINKCIENKKIKLDNIYTFETNTGFLIKNSNNVIGNYHTEVELKKIYNNNILHNKIELEEMTDIIPHIDNFNKSNNKEVLCVKAKWGSGKTHIIIRNILNYANENNTRVILLTENNSLNRKISMDFNIQTHIKNDNLDQNNHIVCSTESINKINFKNTDILILDEYETLINHYESNDTFDNTVYDKFKKFNSALNTVKKIALLDADISIERTELIKEIIGMDFNIFVINTNNFKDYDFNIYTHKQVLFDNMIYDCKTEKIIYPSSSKAHLKTIYNILIKKYPNKNILIYTADEVLFNNSIEPIKKIDIANNIEDFILDNKIDVFLYSPSIKTGISINKNYFNKCYAYAHNKSICAREFIQMLFRARNLINKSINIAFNTSFRPIKPLVNKYNVKRYFINPLFLYKTLTIFENKTANITDELIEDNVNFEPNYLQMKLINTMENFNSNNLFTQEMILRLMYNHNIKLNYFNEFKPLDNDEIEIKLTDEDELIDSFVKAPLIPINEYYDIKYNSSHNKKYKYDWRAIKKAEMIYVIFLIKGLTDNVHPNPELYDKINNKEFYLNMENNKSSYELITSINNKTVNDLKNDEKDNIEYLNSKENDEINKDVYKTGLQIIIIKLLNYLETDINNIPFSITNKKFNTIVNNFKTNGFLNDLNIYFTNYTIKHYYNFDLLKNKNYKDYIKDIKTIISDLLKQINISFKYEGYINTTRDYDKMIFKYNNFNNNTKNYNGRLNENENIINIENIVKSKNIFKDQTGKRVYKNINYETEYYTYYKISLNKKTKLLSRTVNKKINDINEVNNLKHRIVADLFKYFNKINRPFITSQYNKNKIIEHNMKILYDFDNDEVEEEDEDEDQNEEEEEKFNQYPKNTLNNMPVLNNDDMMI
jgi:hypothetical protein